MGDVQGFLVTLTLDSTVITALCNNVYLSRAKNVMSKPTMDGTGIPINLAGSETGTLTMSGQVDTAGQTGLEATWVKSVKVAFILDVGDGAAIKAGTYNGSVTLQTFDIEAAASDAWNFTLDGLTESVSYTPPA